MLHAREGVSQHACKVHALDRDSLGPARRANARPHGCSRRGLVLSAFPAVWLGIVLALTTSVSWAVGNVLTQRLGKLVGAPRAMVWSMAAGGAMAAPLALFLDRRSAPLTGSVALWLCAAAVAGVVAYIGLFFAFANEGLTMAAPVVSSWSLVAGLVSVVFFGEAIRGRRLLGAVFVLVGVVLVSLPRRATKNVTPNDAQNAVSTSRRALLAALASAVGFGLMVPAMGRIAPAMGAFGATVGVYAVGIALALGIGRVSGVSLRAPPRVGWTLVLATGAVETVGFVAVAFARRFAPMTLVAPAASLSSMLTVLYAWVVLRERPRPVPALGAGLACVGVALMAG
jgi:drug/metabolite transporter (DMT)-like permease